MGRTLELVLKKVIIMIISTVTMIIIQKEVYVLPREIPIQPQSGHLRPTVQCYIHLIRFVFVRVRCLEQSYRYWSKFN